FIIHRENRSGAVFHVAELEGAIKAGPHGEVTFGNQISIEGNAGRRQALFITFKSIDGMWIIFQARNHTDALVTQGDQIIHHSARSSAIVDTDRWPGGEFAAAGIDAGNAWGNGVVILF